MKNHGVENHGVENHEGGYPHSHSTPSGNATTGTQVMITFTPKISTAMLLRIMLIFVAMRRCRRGHVNKRLSERFGSATNSISSSHCRKWKVSLDAIRLRDTPEYRLETASRISILHVTAVITLLFSVYAHRMFAIDLLHTITISTSAASGSVG